MDETGFVMPRKARNALIGKVLMVLLIGLAFGYAVETSSRRDYQKGLELTQEKYLEDYEEYRERLLRLEPTAPAVVAIFSVITAFFFFGLYELGGRALGAIVGKVLDLGAGAGRNPEPGSTRPGV